MGQTPQSNSATLSGAAKDDVVGINGDFNFNINDLLANDPGGAAKVDVTKQFFFGDAAPTIGIPSILAQVQYLADHHITATVVDGKFVSFEIGEGATDINYFVQMGNKGTWSTAHVDVTAPEPVDHKGALLMQETFDDHQNALENGGQWGIVNLTEETADHHAWATGGELGTPNGWQAVSGEVVKGNAFPGSIAGTSTVDGNDNWLDTQNSPGGINITNWFHDTIDDGKFVVSFDIGLHDFGTGVMQETPHDGSFEVRINGTAVATITYDELLAKGIASAQPGNTDEMFHYEIEVTGAVSPGLGNHNISLVDTTESDGNFVGFAIDTIMVNDWVV